ncbi:hypothetical protein Hanom_Chr07g00613821 [Helianthus anomalus]
MLLRNLRYCLLILVCVNCQHADLQSRLAILEEVSARATEAEAWARQDEEVRDRLTTSLNQLTADRDWMRDHGIMHSRFTDERSGFHGVDTEAAYAATVDAYNNLSISAIEDIEKCLEAEDYVDRLRLFFDRSEEEDEAASGAKNDAGTSGIKVD